MVRPSPTQMHFRILWKMDVNMRKQIVGLESDGASVMLGCRGGVSTLMKE